MSYCTRYKALVLSEDDAEKRRLLARSRCKQWDCEHCAEVNRAMWRKRIYEYIAAHPSVLWSFHTFTLFGRQHATLLYQQARRIKENWQHTIEWLKRRYGAFEYVRVIERHKKTGALHVHLLASFDIPSEDLHITKKRKNSYIRLLKKGDKKRHIKSVVELGWGYVVDNRNVTRAEGSEGAAGVANYVTKYMTKFKADDLREVLDAKIRIIQSSRGIKVLKKEQVLKWQRVHCIELERFIALTKEGSTVYDVSNGKNLTWDDYEDKDYYPHDIFDNYS
jgi:hypothetical protein